MPYYSVNTIASGLYGVLSSVAQLAVAGVAVPVMQSLTNYAALTANHVADRSASPTSRLSQSRIEAVLQSATVGHISPIGTIATLFSLLSLFLSL